jgi:3-hydroxyacyl-CoA dehydrogenase
VTAEGLIIALQDRFWHATEELLFLHTNPWELDEALTECGFAMGPCEAQDLLGLEKVLARHPERPGPVLRRMVAEGRLGKGGGVGFYRYPGGGGAVIDPLIEDLILEEAWFARLTREELPETELAARMLQVLGQLNAELCPGKPDQEVRQLLETSVQYEGPWPLG